MEQTQTSMSSESSVPDEIPYLDVNAISLGKNAKYYVEVYGCQMNVNDTEILMSIMNSSGYSRTEKFEEADIIFLVTCAIREKAENKIWQRLNTLKSINSRLEKGKRPMIGVLGCMAERLKTKLLDADKLVDIVCGPDAYRSIPHLLSLAIKNSQGIANVMLSADETYADITPVRLHNTNEYEFYKPNGIGDGLSNEGFKTIYRRKEGGIRFTELLDNVSLVDPEMRIRFTSPHPKDFPIELLKLISERPNICNQIHLPVQSGNTNVLRRMRRGYSREAYLDLVNTIRDVIPNVSLSTDIITGFCGETEEEHQDTLSLLEIVKFDMAFMYAYRTIKIRRLNEIIRIFHDNAKIRLSNLIGRPQLILVEGYSKRDNQRLRGLSDGGHKVYFNDVEVIDCANMTSLDLKNIGLAIGSKELRYLFDEGKGLENNSFGSILRKTNVKSGDYVLVVPTSTTGSSLDSVPLAKMSITQFSDDNFGAEMFKKVY
ncbi:9962_t:CDS:2 [Acaulospora colombiana]|uniref:9962_t:CDS:1 n=1 Tax=Acaulospora colombiana TaxID=27376 RepID=A0ACA9KNX0_9GLOM|nr:9962_t:CDS:2 [Acaulospora colombiana]